MALIGKNYIYLVTDTWFYHKILNLHERKILEVGWHILPVLE